MEFECRYTHDWAYNQALYRAIRRQNLASTLFWVLFAAFGGAMCVYSVHSAGSFTAVSAFYALILAAVLLFLLSVPLQVRRGWRKNCEKWGRDSFEAELKFGQSILFHDDTGMEADIPWSKVTELVLLGDFFLLRGDQPARKKGRTKKVNFLYFPKSGFADGTGDAFLLWVAREHPGVALSGADRDKLLKQQEQ